MFKWYSIFNILANTLKGLGSFLFETICDLTSYLHLIFQRFRYNKRGWYYIKRKSPPWMCNRGPEARTKIPPVRVSVAHPKRLSKRVSSLILVSIYNGGARVVVRRIVTREFKGDHIEHLMNAHIPENKPIIISLFCPGILFSESVKTKLEDGYVSTTFIARPDDDSSHGKHQVRVAITDGESDREYYSRTFTVTITDFVFDHISQPLFSKVSAVLLAIGSFIMFTLTLLKEIDIATGLTSGTTAAAIAAAIYGRSFILFHQSREN